MMVIKIGATNFPTVNSLKALGLKFTSVTILLVTLIFYGKAQSNLQIGNSVPDFNLEKIINYSKQSVNLSDYKNKIIIIDFWSTWCGSCIKDMPKMAKLQEKFRNDFQLFYVTPESKQTIERFLSQRKFIKDLNLPIVTEDKSLTKAFPHEGIPHVILIGKDRKVKAITTSIYITEANIQSLLLHGNIDLPTKRDIDFNYQMPFLQTGQVNDSSIVGNSVLTRYINGIASQTIVHTIENDKLRVAATNLGLLSLYQFAYRFQINLLPGELTTRVLLNVKDKSRFKLLDGSVEEAKKHGYCYETILPIEKNTKVAERLAFSTMQTDLDRYFNLISSVEKIKVNCYILSLNSTANGNLSEKAFIKEDFENIELVNQPASILIAYIYNYNPKLPVIFEGNSQMKLSIKIKKKYHDISGLLKDLQEAGINVKTDEREIAVLKICDVDDNSQEIAHKEQSLDK